jgi:hypothetical protein
MKYTFVCEDGPETYEAIMNCLRLAYICAGYSPEIAASEALGAFNTKFEQLASEYGGKVPTECLFRFCIKLSTELMEVCLSDIGPIGEKQCHALHR